MNLFSRLFSKSKITPTPRKFYICKDGQRQFWHLVDLREAKPSYENKFLLWEYIGKLHPETLEGSWRIGKDDIHHPYVEEVFEDE